MCDISSQNLWGVSLLKRNSSETEPHLSSFVVKNSAMETAPESVDSIHQVSAPACVFALVMHVLTLTAFGYFGSFGGRIFDPLNFSNELYRFFNSSNDGELLAFDNGDKFLLVSMLTSIAFSANAFRAFTSLPFVASKQRPAV